MKMTAEPNDETATYIECVNAGCRSNKPYEPKEYTLDELLSQCQSNPPFIVYTEELDTLEVCFEDTTVIAEHVNDWVSDVCRFLRSPQIDFNLIQQTLKDGIQAQSDDVKHQKLCEALELIRKALA